MRRQSFYQLSGDHLELDEIDRYYRVVESAIRLYYSERNPGFGALFQDYTLDAIQREMQDRLDEHDLTMSMSLLSALEAAFRIDYSIRCQRRMKGKLSRSFRDLHAAIGTAGIVQGGYTVCVGAEFRHKHGKNRGIEERYRLQELAGAR